MALTLPELSHVEILPEYLTHIHVAYTACLDQPDRIVSKAAPL